MRLQKDISALRDDYAVQGHCELKSFLAPDVAARLLLEIGEDINRAGLENFLGQTNIHSSNGVEVYSHDYKLLNAFQWGMTPILSEIANVDLAPSFAYFQIYRRGNRLFVHHDRPSCEHSMSLTLGYSDDKPWPITIGKTPVSQLNLDQGKITEDHGADGYHELEGLPGDAVFYPGNQRRHGRIVPNPNRWSAHIFLHWVEASGANADKLFDGKMRETSIDFKLPMIY